MKGECGAIYSFINVNMKNMDAVERPSMMYMIPRTAMYSGLSNLGIRVTMKQPKQAKPRTVI